MNISKSVVLSTVEPHPLSFRAPMGIDTNLNVTFYGQNGLPYSSDLAAQLQLTGRSSDRTTTYLMPATDIANGRARATIPAGGIADINGYRLRMVGTFNGESALLAMGAVMPIAAAGVEAVPEDIIDTINLTIAYNEPVQLDIALWEDTGKGSPYDLTEEGTAITATVQDAKGGGQIMPFTVVVLTANMVQLSLTAEQVNQLPSACWWSLVASTSAGATTLAEGSVTVTGTVIPPLTETTAAYDYQKPDDLNPIGGQIIHGNFTRDLLKVSTTTQLAVDFTPTLILIEAGDEIVIGATTWMVTSVGEQPGWYEFRITPLTQDAVTGVTTVTFRRP